jgi:RNA polymerase sigma-70 factor, ECF subfamily
MDSAGDRNRGMNETLVAPAAQAPSAAEAEFEALYRSSRDDVYAYVHGLLRDRVAAEDVTAQAFERAYRRRASFDRRRGSHRAWLFGIARNAALDELRRRKRHTALATEPEDPAVASSDDAAEAALRRSTIRAAMEQLSPRERELIALKYFAGLGNAEIATVVGVSESNAGTKLHRVIEKLREACDEG